MRLHRIPVVLNASLRALPVKASNKRLGVLGKNASRFTSLECFCEHEELNRQGGYRVSSRSGGRICSKTHLKPHVAKNPSELMSRKSAIYIGFSSALSWLEGETNDAENQQAHHPTITEELINTASVTLAAELIAPNASLYVPGMPEPLRGPSGFLSIVEMMRGGFPDIQWPGPTHILSPSRLPSPLPRLSPTSTPAPSFAPSSHTRTAARHRPA